MTSRDLAMATIGAVFLFFGLSIVSSLKESMVLKDCQQFGVTRLDGKVVQCYIKEKTP